MVKGNWKQRPLCKKNNTFSDLGDLKEDISHENSKPETCEITTLLLEAEEIRTSVYLQYFKRGKKIFFGLIRRKKVFLPGVLNKPTFLLVS